MSREKEDPSAGTSVPAESPSGLKPDRKEIYSDDIESYEGIVPFWLILVFASLAIWGIVYTYRYWGGLGPGIGNP